MRRIEGMAQPIADPVQIDLGFGRAHLHGVIQDRGGKNVALGLDHLRRADGVQGNAAAVGLGLAAQHDDGMGLGALRRLPVCLGVLLVGIPVAEARDDHGEHRGGLADVQPETPPLALRRRGRGPLRHGRQRRGRAAAAAIPSAYCPPLR